MILSVGLTTVKKVDVMVMVSLVMSVLTFTLPYAVSDSSLCENKMKLNSLVSIVVNVLNAVKFLKMFKALA